MAGFKDKRLKKIVYYLKSELLNFCIHKKEYQLLFLEVIIRVIYSILIKVGHRKKRYDKVSIYVCIRG